MTKTKAQPALAPAALPTEREVSAPYGACGYCGATPAVFSSIRSDYLCAGCTQTNLLSDACSAHLTELTAPIIAAWGHHWTAVGLSPEDLTAHLECFTQADQTEGAAQLLTSTLEAYPVEKYVPAQPDRVLLDVGALPTIALLP